MRDKVQLLYETLSKKWKTGMVDEYDLKIDEQVNSFHPLSQNLTYFMITAAVGTLGFSLNFLVSNKLLSGSNPLHIVLITIASLCALLCAGLSIRALRCDMKSFRLHLKYRQERKSFLQIGIAKQNEWDAIIASAQWARDYALYLLICTVAILLFTIILLFIQKGDQTMHHYGEDSSKIISLENMFLIEFTNKETKQTIIMQIPKKGVRENGEDEMTTADVGKILNEVAPILRKNLK